VTVGLWCPYVTVRTPAVWHVCGTAGEPWTWPLCRRILVDVDEPEQVGDQATTSSSTFPTARRSAAAS